jgi:homoserine kinase
MTGVATAPASSGNLGPGFDVLALALELRCVVKAELSDTWIIAEAGQVYEPAAGDLVVRAVEAAVGRPMRLEIDNAIPRARGLGSSSAVTAAAAAAAVRATGAEPDASRLFAIVADLEGHADNAAAAVYGGFVAASDDHIRRLEVHEDLRFVVGIPDTKLRTDEARAVLDAQVDRFAAARNLARLAFLIEGVRTADPATLAAAAGDELHEAPRHHLSPLTGKLMDAARGAGALHAAWSGAGPTAIAVTLAERCDGVESAMAALLGDEGEVRCLDVAVDGWR